jgi:hypothetical protein
MGGDMRAPVYASRCAAALHATLATLGALRLLSLENTPGWWGGFQSLPVGYCMYDLVLMLLTPSIFDRVFVVPRSLRPPRPLYPTDVAVACATWDGTWLAPSRPKAGWPPRSGWSWQSYVFWRRGAHPAGPSGAALLGGLCTKAVAAARGYHPSSDQCESGERPRPPGWPIFAPPSRQN